MFFKDFCTGITLQDLEFIDDVYDDDVDDDHDDDICADGLSGTGTGKKRKLPGGNGSTGLFNPGVPVSQMLAQRVAGTAGHGIQNSNGSQVKLNFLYLIKSTSRVASSKVIKLDLNLQKPMRC